MPSFFWKGVQAAETEPTDHPPVVPPSLDLFSSSTTSRPSRAASMAAASPDPPPPTTTTSASDRLTVAMMLCLPLLRRHPSIDCEHGASSERGFVTRKVQYRLRDLLGLSKAVHDLACLKGFSERRWVLALGLYLGVVGRFDRARSYAVDPYVLRSVVQGHGLRKRCHAPFRGTVGRPMLYTNYRPHRSRVDDNATALAAHHRDCILAPEVDALEVYRHQAVPIGFFCLYDVRSEAVPSVVDQYVEAAVLLDRVMDHLLDARRARDVHPPRDGLGAAISRQCCHFLGRRSIYVCDDHIGSLASEQQAHGPSDTRAPARDYANFVVKSHCSSNRFLVRPSDSAAAISTTRFNSTFARPDG